MKNILITTYNTPAIIEEIIGFTNYGESDFYRNSPNHYLVEDLINEHKILPVDELWIIKTGEGNPADDPVLKKQSFLPLMRYWYPEGVSDIDSTEAVLSMKELIFRCVYTSLQYREDGGKVYLSLTGGRKTMSSDMQMAASYFGADLLFHVLKEGEGSEEGFFPVIIDKNLPVKQYVKYLGKNKYKLGIDHPAFNYSKKNSLVSRLDELRLDSESLLVNYKEQLKGEVRSNFRELYFLPSETIAELKRHKTGINKDSKELELDFLRKLPKAELHCHLGGVALPEDIIKIAKANSKYIYEYKNKNAEFLKWFDGIRELVSGASKDITVFEKLLPYRNKEYFKGISFGGSDQIPLFVKVSAFLTCFDGYPDLLKELVYYGFEENFNAIGIEEYQKMGDFQGSTLLQTEEAIREVCKVLKRISKENNIIYFEVRCSPEKYTQAGLDSKDVLSIIMDELSNSKTYFGIIIIGSRHTEKEELENHVNLVKELISTEAEFRKFFVGFDLAGTESAAKPVELRDEFLPLMEECTNLTIHAGEGMEVRNIWEAVYHLNADRIGHGLSLLDNEFLVNRFLERNISVEMCPTSNYQIVGFWDKFTNPDCHKVYPLEEYLKRGIRVTINTDDPGISLTNLTMEYYKAACMSGNGLSLWDILLIVRNGFRASFIPQKKRVEILHKAEEQIIKIINNKESEIFNG